MRKQIVLSIVFANILSLPLVGSSVGSVAHAATDCLAAPNAPSPRGSHWYYRVDRVNKRKCWYLGPQGQKTRSDAVQVASPGQRRAALPETQPMASIPVAPQAATVAVVRPVNAEPSSEADIRKDLPGDGVSVLVSEQPQLPDPNERAPVLANDQGVDERAVADADDEMPLIWPVLASSEVAAAEQRPSTVLQLVFMIALLAGSLLFAGFMGRAILDHARTRSFDQPVKWAQSFSLFVEWWVRRAWAWATSWRASIPYIRAPTLAQASGDPFHQPVAAERARDANDDGARVGWPRRADGGMDRDRVDIDMSLWHQRTRALLSQIEGSVCATDKTEKFVAGRVR